MLVKIRERFNICSGLSLIQLDDVNFDGASVTFSKFFELFEQAHKS